MTGIIVDAIDPVTDILVSFASPGTDIVGRRADPVMDIIVSVITPTTDIATSRGPLALRYLHLNKRGRVDLD